MTAMMGFPSGGEANQGWKLYLTSLIMILSSGFIVIARIVIRLRADKLKADDYTIIASLVFSIALSVNIQLAVVHGYGQHKNDLSTEELQTCLKFFWIAQTPYKIVVCLNKTSVILLYMRIFISRYFRWLCYGALAIVVGSGIATVFATIFQCVREVFKLQHKLQEKIMLYSVFLFGGFVTITSILRVTAVANSVHNQHDQTWNFIPRGIWTLIEANLSIICACLIVLKQLVEHFLLSMFSPSHGVSGAAGGHTSASTKRDAPIINRQHFRLDDTVDYEDMRTHENAHRHRNDGEAVESGGSSNPMTSLAYRDTSDGRRDSDEKHIMSVRATERDPSQSSMESEDIVTGWPLDLGPTSRRR